MAPYLFDSHHLQLGNILPGVLTPVPAKHSKSFSLIDCIPVGVYRMQRNFEPMRKQVDDASQKFELRDVTAKVVIYEAFVEGKLEAPRHLARSVHDLYFEPKYEEFQSRTIVASRMLLRRGSKNSIRSRNSGRLRSWGSFWRRGSRKRLSGAWRYRSDRWSPKCLLQGTRLPNKSVKGYL